VRVTTHHSNEGNGSPSLERGRRSGGPITHIRKEPEAVCGLAFAAGGEGEMRRKKIGKRGSVIIALLAVIAALAASPVASGASWGGEDAFYNAPGASWGDSS
jgi:hypothetical protein